MHTAQFQDNRLIAFYVGMEGSFGRLHRVNIPILIQSSVTLRLTMDSDPGKVPSAAVLPSIDPREANELTYAFERLSWQNLLTWR